MRRLLDRLRRRDKTPLPASRPPELRTNETTIPPIPTELLDDELKTWAREADVGLERPIEGMWWDCDDHDEALAQVRAGVGFVGLQFHGGGYVLGSAMDVRSGMSRIPRGLLENGVCSCLLAVEYSLIDTRDEEENRAFPLQILEVMSAYYYLVHILNVPPKRIILVGDSAGGHLALALQRSLLRSTALPAPGGMILMSPWCDLSVEGHRPAVSRLLGPRNSESLSDPFFSPSLHVPPPQWPPTLVYYGANERFAESIATLVSHLKDGGTSVTAYAAENIPERFSHDFWILVSVERGWPEEVRKSWVRMKAWVDALNTE